MKRAMIRRWLAAWFLPFWVATAAGQVPSGPAPEENVVTESAGPAIDSSSLDPYFSRRNFWMEGEYLGWWIQGTNLPPMVTSSPAGTPQNLAGVLGQPDTSTLWSGRDNQYANGGRFTVVYADNPLRYDAWEFGVLALFNQASLFSAGPGDAVLARPFFNQGTGANDSQLFSYPGIATGSFSSNIDQFAWGAELNVRPNAMRFGSVTTGRIDWLAGLRYFQFQETLKTNESLTTTATNSPILAGTQIGIQEQFDCENYFFAGQVGVGGELRYGFLSFGLLGKLAMGAVYQNFGVNGTTQVTVPNGQSSTQSGGIIANETNIGRDNKTLEFGVLPEVDLKVGAQVASRLRLTCGYSFLYLNPLIRPQNLVSNSFNPSILPASDPTGQRRPSRNFGTSDAWLMGLNLGMELRF